MRRLAQTLDLMQRTASQSWYHMTLSDLCGRLAAFWLATLFLTFLWSTPDKSDAATSVPRPMVQADIGDFRSRIVQASNDGELLAFASDTGLDLFERKSGRLLRRVPISASTFALSHDLSKIALGTDGEVALISVETGKELFRKKILLRKEIENEADIDSIIFSTDDKTLYVATYNDVFTVDVHSERIVNKLAGSNPSADSVGNLYVATQWNSKRYSVSSRGRTILSFDKQVLTTAEKRSAMDGAIGPAAKFFFLRKPKEEFPDTVGSELLLYNIEYKTFRRLGSLAGGEKPVMDASDDNIYFVKIEYTKKDTPREWKEILVRYDTSMGEEVARRVVNTKTSETLRFQVDLCSMSVIPKSAELAVVMCDGSRLILDRFSLQTKRAIGTPADKIVHFRLDERRGLVYMLAEHSGAHIYNLFTGAIVGSFGDKGPKYLSLALSGDGDRLAITDQEGSVWVWATKTRSLLRQLPGNPGFTMGEPDDPAYKNSIALSYDGKFLFRSIDLQNKGRVVQVFDVETGALEKVATPPSNDAAVVIVSPDGGRVLMNGPVDTVSLRSASLEVIASFPFDKVWLSGGGFSEDGSDGYVVRNGHLRAFRSKDGAQIPGPSETIRLAVCANTCEIIVYQAPDKTITLWDKANKPKRFRTRDNQNSSAFQLSSNGSLLISVGEDGILRFVDTRLGSVMAELVMDQIGGWTVVSDYGYFDAAALEGGSYINFVMPDDPLRPLAPETFLRDYYEPRLLSRLLACHDEEARELARGDDPRACQRAFKPVRPLRELNRIQPEVRIEKVERGTLADEALVTVETAGKADPSQKNEKKVTAAYDLRLFRGGQIVGQWPKPKASIGGAEEIETWLADSLVPGTKDQGKVAHQFRVKLAARDKGHAVHFTAYAFNEDRVKSETVAHDDYKVPEDIAVTMPRAYVITIGVNAYQNPAWRLGFAVKDARDLSGALQQLQGYTVVPVTLVSVDDESTKRDQANKANIAAVLGVLGGDDEHRAQLRDQLGAVVDKLRKVTPDDLVILSFSGHGYTDKQGRFYLLPSDSGTEALSEATLPDSLPKFISSDELSQWLRDIDAGEMVMLIDACHSAASVREGFKPGPMGDRGLGQLAYDKGMQILAATQADNVALESQALGQGLLTYALVEDGLNSRKATPEGKGPITIKSWLHYAEKRVPELYEEIRSGKRRLVGFDVTGSKTADRQLASKDPLIDPIFYADVVRHAQTPTLFDFYKGQQDVVVQ